MLTGARGYHYHRRRGTGQSFASQDEMLKKLSPAKVKQEYEDKAVNFIESRRRRFIYSLNYRGQIA